jgi:hypothetical protein
MKARVKIKGGVDGTYSATNVLSARGVLYPKL